MSEQRDGNSPSPEAHPTSRRGFLKSGAGLVAAGTAVQVLPEHALAQAPGAPERDAELDRLRTQRRILLQGGIVLTLDRQLGDFARADVLIEDGKIREVRPGIAAGDDAMVIDASERIVIPGFVDTHSHSYQGLLRSSLPNGIVDPDYVRDVQNSLTPAYRPADVFAGVLVDRARHDRHGHHRDGGYFAGSNHTPEHSDALIAALKEAEHPDGCAPIRAAWGRARNIRRMPRGCGKPISARRISC